MRTVQEPPRSVAPKNFPRASTWPCTRCPPSRVTGVTERSRFTGMPGPKLPSVDRSNVSRDTSAANELLFTSSAVRQTPLTAIESPSWMSSVTRRASITTRALSPRCLMLLTRPSSSMIPVNIVEFQIVNSQRRNFVIKTMNKIRSPKTAGPSENTSIQIGSNWNEHLNDLTVFISLSLPSATLLLNGRHHLLKDFIDRQSGRVNNDRIVSNLQWRIGARGIPSIPFSHVGESFFKANTRVLSPFLIEPSFRP